jgi:hypothetical protein
MKTAKKLGNNTHRLMITFVVEGNKWVGVLAGIFYSPSLGKIFSVLSHKKIFFVLKLNSQPENQCCGAGAGAANSQNL